MTALLSEWSWNLAQIRAERSPISFRPHPNLSVAIVCQLRYLLLMIRGDNESEGSPPYQRFDLRPNISHSCPVAQFCLTIYIEQLELRKHF